MEDLVKLQSYLKKYWESFCYLDFLNIKFYLFIMELYNYSLAQIIIDKKLNIKEIKEILEQLNKVFIFNEYYLFY